MWDFKWEIFKKNSKWTKRDGYILRVFRLCEQFNSVNPDSNLMHDICEREEKITLEHFVEMMSQKIILKYLGSIL